MQRLIELRSVVCPDYPYQLGFRGGAQCSDHILTLSIIIQKYTQKALMYRLGSMGISGNFSACIKNMYSNSKSRVKLFQKLLKTINVTIGTEQGHPLSPELFKMFIHDFSTRRMNIEDLSVPLLNCFPMSHLLSTDDLILLALDAKSLQMQLDCLHEFVSEWELSINIQKTNIMGSKLLNCSYGFKLDDLKVEPARKYCYLGTLFSLQARN